MDDGAGRHSNANFIHRFPEQFTIFRLINCFNGSSDQLYSIFSQYPLFIKLNYHVERSLTTHGGQNHIGPFLPNDYFQSFQGNWFNICCIHQSGISHDGGRITVDQDDFVAFFFECFAGLRTAVIKFAGLPNHDGS